jgi:uncharacterized iron-regulated membrane protein
MTKSPKTSLRNLLRTFHLAAGLTLGVWFVLLGITGAMMVFWPEVDAALNPALLRNAPGAHRIGPQAVWDTARAARPDVTFKRFLPPRTTNGVYTFRWGAKDDERELFVDPVRGIVTGERRRAETVLWTALQWHTKLLLREPGQRANGVLAIGGVFLLLSGLILWWPSGWRQARARLTLSPGASPVRRWTEWHYVASVYPLPILLLITLTGAAFLYEHQTEALFAALWGRPVTAKSPTSTLPTPPPPSASGADALSLDEALRRSEDAAPGTKFLSIELPAHPGDPVKVLREPSGGNRWGDRITVTVNSTGEPLLADNRNDPKDKQAMRWMGALHFGRWGGVVSKALYVAVGLVVPLALFVTGFSRWWLLRRARLQHARRTAVSSPSPGILPVD